MKTTEFIESFNNIAEEVAYISKSRGWTVNTSTEGIASKIALMHSELSEALEALRHGDPPSDHIPSYSGMEEKFADVIIRIMHVSHVLGLKVPAALIEKLTYNSTKPHKHGGKLI